MRRIQIHIEEDLDAVAAAEARRRGMSKAALIRQLVAEGMARHRTDRGVSPAWDDMIGWLDDDPVTDIDEAIYGSTP